MTLSDLQVFIGSLTNDPTHDRYTTTDIGTELDNLMDQWNVEAKLIKATVSVTLTGGTRQYAISSLTGTPIAFNRVTHNGLELKKVDKSYMDQYTGTDWTQDSGTPKKYLIEVTDPTTQYLTLHPTPATTDASYAAVVEYTKRHTSMSASSDVPFMSGSSSDTLLRPYDYGLAFGVASHLLLRDPSEINAAKAANYQRLSTLVFGDVVQVFKNIEREEPYRLRGGRYWNGAYQYTDK